MSTPKFILLYSDLQAKEKARFKDFVMSPFFNRREKLNRLLDYIASNTAGWDKRAAHAHVFDPHAFNELQLNNLLSDLYKLLEQYFAWIQLEKNKANKDVLVIENMLNSSSSKPVESLIGKKTQSSVKDAHVNYRFHLLADQYHFQRSRKNDNSYLLKSQAHLDLHYLSAKLKIWCELLNRSNILALNYDEAELRRFIEYLEACLPTCGNYHGIRIYYPILKWLKNSADDEWYTGYREILFSHITEFPEPEAKEIIAYVQNYCVKRINEGRTSFLGELLEVFRFMLPLNLLNEGSYLSQWTYKNVVTVGVRLKEFVWTEQFIHTYYQKLPPRDRENAYHYNLAAFYYESGDIRQAMQLLNRLQFTDPSYYLDAKCILLKIYFEQHEYEAMISLRDTVKIYLLRERQLSHEQKMLYKNLFRLTYKVFKLQLNKNSMSKEKWHEAWHLTQLELAQNSQVANKVWLTAKLQAIKDPVS